MKTNFVSEMKKLFLLVTIFLSVNFAFCAQSRFSSASDFEVTYDNHKIIRVPYTDDIKKAVENQNLDLFSVDGDHFAVIHVSPSQYSNILDQFPDEDITLLEDNIQDLIDQEKLDISSVQGNDWFLNYHTYDEIYQWYKNLAAQYSSLVKIESIGSTHEGRDIFAVRITSDKNKDSKKQIYFQGQIHAREWISGATVGYLVNEFITKYGIDDKITNTLDTVELLVVPCLNADGYAHTWAKERLWRKNRRDNGKGFAFGVDLNRNFNSRWGQGGSSSSPSSDTYKGPSPASEPETQAVVKFFLKNQKIVGAIDFHSFSQLVLRPWGYNTKKPKHDSALKNLGDRMSQIIKSVDGMTYKSIAAVELYVTTGSASDWFYEDEVLEKFGHRVYGYTIELRPTGFSSSGFILHPRFIIPVGKEIYPAVQHFIETVRDNPLYE
jgi:murein tripeptide amidase MpaA